MDKIQIHTIFLFQFKLGQKTAETACNINDAFGPGTTNERVAQQWFKKFRNGDESLEDEDGRGRPTAVDNEHLKVLIEADPRKSTREVAVELEVDHSTVVCHLKQIGKSKKLDKWVPHELNDNQKNRRFEVSSTLLLRNKNDPFFKRIVMCDEKWILYDNRRRSAQWLDAGEALQHFLKPKLHQKKVMVTVWWSAAGLIIQTYTNEEVEYHQSISMGRSHKMAVCVAAIAKENYPLYIKTIATDNELKFYYTVHTSLDVVEEKISSVGKNTNDLRELYLGLLYPTEDYKVYGYVTNTKVKFVIVVESSNTSLRDNEIRSMFKKLHNAYVDMLCNPFYTPGETITSKTFENVVLSMMQQET